jgi:hypothetical protein
MNDSNSTQRADKPKRKKTPSKTRKKPENLKKVFVGIKLTEQEQSRIIADMSRYGYDNISTYIREKALDTAVKYITKPDNELLKKLAEIHTELNKQGINLNEITTKFNANKKQLDEESAEAFTNIMKDFVKQLQGTKEKLSIIADELLTNK